MGDDNFEHILSGQYGQMEAAIGSEAYQANIAMSQSQIKCNEQITTAHSAYEFSRAKKNEALAFLFRSIALVILLISGVALGRLLVG